MIHINRFMSWFRYSYHDSKVHSMILRFVKWFQDYYYDSNANIIIQKFLSRFKTSQILIMIQRFESWLKDSYSDFSDSHHDSQIHHIMIHSMIKHEIHIMIRQFIQGFKNHTMILKFTSLFTDSHRDSKNHIMINRFIIMIQKFISRFEDLYHDSKIQMIQRYA